MKSVILKLSEEKYLKECTAKILDFEKRIVSITLLLLCMFLLFIIYSFLFLFYVIFIKKNFSLSLFLYCFYFSSDFSLNVLIKFVLNKKESVIAQKLMYN